MNALNQVLPMMIMICFLLGTSCKKKKFNNEFTEEPKVAEPSKKAYLPTKFESKSLRITLKYQDQTALLTNIESSTGKRAEITYKNGMLLKVAFYLNDKPTGFLDFQNSNNKAINVNSWEEQGKLNILIDNHTLSYDSRDRLAEVHFYGIDHVLFQQIIFTYNTADNISSIITERMANNTSAGFSYKYDTNNGIFKDVRYFQILFREFGYDFFHPNPNNPVSVEEATSKSEYAAYSYLYNEKGYPSEMTITKNALKESYNISYKEIQL